MSDRPDQLAPPSVEPRSRAIARDHPDYPAGLNDLADPPAVVHVRGQLPGVQRAVAMVGSRAATPYGVEQATRLAGDLARLGYTIVSGLAHGIDAAAHRGALAAGGATVAVLPAGLDAVTPRHHRELASQVARRGALVTEVASGAPRPGMFLRRNRLIAALAGVTVVVEAAERSGALSTAAAARRLARPLLAFPGDVDRPTSRGCHALIRGGARLCEGARDVVDALGTPVAPSDGAETRVLAALEPRARTADQVASVAALPIPATLAALLRLEWAGLAVAHPGPRWARASKGAP